MVGWLGCGGWMVSHNLLSLNSTAVLIVLLLGLLLLLGCDNNILFKTNIHCIRMNEKIPNDIEELTFEMFENTFEDLKLNKSTKYQFFIKGGNSVQNL